MKEGCYCKLVDRRCINSKIWQGWMLHRFHASMLSMPHHWGPLLWRMADDIGSGSGGSSGSGSSGSSGGGSGWHQPSSCHQPKTGGSFHQLQWWPWQNQGRNNNQRTDNAGFMVRESWRSGDNDGHSHLATWAFKYNQIMVATAHYVQNHVKAWWCRINANRLQHSGGKWWQRWIMKNNQPWKWWRNGNSITR